MKKIIYIFASLFIFIVSSLLIISYKNARLFEVSGSRGQTLRVLAYSNFLKSWGPGKELAANFEKTHGIQIEWIEVGNAGMILENLRGRTQQDMPDVVLGLDILSLEKARKSFQWKTLHLQGLPFAQEIPRRAIYKDFAPFDWSPMTFVFKRGNLKTPLRLDDLLKSEYANSLALQDPATSSTGLYFLMWVLSVKGEVAGYEYLKSLKPSIRLVSPSWSSSYSLFQNNQVPMVFTFFTSTIYHLVNENDANYQPVYFDDPHIYSIEYAGVPQGCANCKLAEDFVKYLLSSSSQKIIMEKNFMLPVIEGVKKNTPFDFPKNIRLIDPKQYDELLQRRETLLKRWSELRL